MTAALDDEDSECEELRRRAEEKGLSLKDFEKPIPGQWIMTVSDHDLQLFNGKLWQRMGPIVSLDVDQPDFDESNQKAELYMIRRGRLSQGLDREVNQVVRKIIDEKTQYGGDFRPTFASIYDEIKLSNSSLNRRPKKVLEESIERVLEVVNHDAGSSDSGDSDQPVPSPRRQQSNGINRSIVAMWPKNVPTPPPKEGTADPEPGKQVASEATNGEPPRKKRKRAAAAAAAAVDHSPPTHVSLADLGGIDDIIEQFSELLYMPLIQPESMASSKIQPIRGILIHGPPGCGKTSIANAIAAEFGVNFINVSAPSIVSGMSGESEKALRDHFEEAKRVAPSILFLDEIDAVATKRESASREMEKRIVAQLATCMDDLDVTFNDGKPVIVLAATNRPDSLDAGLRRAGRFDKEVIMSVPSEAMRLSVLQAITRDTLLAADVDLAVLAKRTPGFVGADLKDLVSTASSAAMQRIQETHQAAAAMEQQEESGEVAMEEGGTDAKAADLPPALTKLRRLIIYGRAHPSTSATITLSQHDFITSLPKVSPSALREGFATVPTTTFESIGAHLSLIEELQRTLIGPIMKPERFRELGIQPSSGSLLFGPPGCGKTLLAAATAHHSSANFISIAGPSLLNKYVGESEAAVRRLFHRARASVPVVIFFDELDALVPRRDKAGNDASARVVNTLLSELDGVGNSREGIYVIAATNRPDIIDPAMLRPGRLETMLYVGLPDADGRVDILRRITRSLRGFSFTDRIADIARQCEGFSGADLESLKRRAGYAAVKRFNATKGVSDAADAPLTLVEEDFEVARGEVRRSVSDSDMKKYERLRREWEKS
ncbi:hypothetical protein DV737_g398, partial [Chaetothyriales sp. CBS 132003]